MINKDHPKYQEFKRLSDELFLEYEKVDPTTMDSTEYNRWHKNFSKSVSALQHEYEFLWPGGLK